MTSRAGLRLFSQSARPQFLRTPLRQRQHFKTVRRYQSTEATSTQPQSLFQRLWTSEVGIKTVHFWAPVMKWALVIAGIGDFFRPAEKLSLTQNLALLATGSIWTRWCLIIKPRNVLLAAVNACLACVGVVQVSRILTFQSTQKGSTEEAIKAEAADIKDQAKGLEKSVEKKVA
ncbi:MAG: hypothetical protein Q9160_001042 [Pyrenula sp. 1 TL-2023]